MRLLVLTFTILLSCDNKRSSDCVFGASSPIDVALTNDCDSDEEVSLYSFNSRDKIFELIKTIKVDKGTNKLVCIDNEGSVTEGLYIKMADRTKLITLKWAETFKLNLCDNSFLLDMFKGPN